MRIHSEPIDVALKAPFRIATGEVVQAQNVLCSVEQDGANGVGEATPFEVITGGTQTKVLHDLRRLSELEARDADDVEILLARLQAQGLCGDARQALDAALHDWLAQRRRVPLATLLGGAPRPLPTSVTIPIVDLYQVPGLVEDALEQGFQILKVKSKAGVETESKRLRLIRDVAGSKVELRVDANAGWSLAESKQMMRVLRETEVRFLEQPLRRDDLRGHAELVRLDELPIMVDESVFTFEDAQRVVREHAADLINVKLAKSGGIVEAGKILRFAEERGIDCMVGCMIQTRIASSQDAHVAAAFKAVKFVDLDGHTFLKDDPIQGGVTIQDGRLVFPDSHGHGARRARRPVVTV